MSNEFWLGLLIFAGFIGVAIHAINFFRFVAQFGREVDLQQETDNDGS